MRHFNPKIVVDQVVPVVEMEKSSSSTRADQILLQCSAITLAFTSGCTNTDTPFGLEQRDYFISQGSNIAKNAPIQKYCSSPASVVLPSFSFFVTLFACK